MGLDSFASRTPGDIELTEEDESAFAAAGLCLCGGMYSGGESSFRGKIYDSLILESTGVSLYQEWLSPEEVKALSEKLDNYSPQQLAEVSEKFEVSADRAVGPGPCEDLQKFFRICAERGLGLIGWW